MHYMKPSFHYKDERKTPHENNKKKKKGLKSHIGEISFDYSWYFDFKTTRHVTKNKTCWCPWMSHP